MHFKFCCVLVAYCIDSMNITGVVSSCEALCEGEDHIIPEFSAWFVYFNCIFFLQFQLIKSDETRGNTA